MNISVLVIDSHPVYTQKMKNFLKGFSFRSVSLAPTGREGVRKAIVERPELIIVSGVLCDMHSEEVCWQIKELAKVRTKIIVLVGLFTEEDELRNIRKHGADDILMKKEKDLVPLQQSIQRLFVP